jgi:hypothetical protein
VAQASREGPLIQDLDLPIAGDVGAFQRSSGCDVQERPKLDHPRELFFSIPLKPNRQLQMLAVDEIAVREQLR